MPASAAPSWHTLATRSYDEGAGSFVRGSTGTGTWSARRSGRPPTGNVTIVGFFSRKNAFLVNRLWCTTRYFGSFVNVNVRIPPRGVGVGVAPSYFRSKSAMGTCGMMFFSMASWNRGGGGRSNASMRNGVTVRRTEELTSFEAASFEPAEVSSGSPAVTTSISPAKQSSTTDPPPCLRVSRCSACMSHCMKSTGSAGWSTLNAPLELATTARMNSCGETCPLNALGFHILRVSSPKRDAKTPARFLSVSLDSRSFRKNTRNGSTRANACNVAFAYVVCFRLFNPTAPGRYSEPSRPRRHCFATLVFFASSGVNRGASAARTSSSDASSISYPSGRQYALPSSSRRNTWCDASSACVYACVLGPRPWKYLPHTRHAYTLCGDKDTEQHFSKSKSKTARCTVSR